MFDWHISLHDGSCSMCAAGAVARFGVGEIKSGENWHPFHSDVNFRQYCAIDFLRDGSVCVAASELNINLNPSVDDFYVISPYSESPDKWKADMESLATKLEDAGL